MWDAHWTLILLHYALFFGALICMLPATLLLVEVISAKRKCQPEEPVTSTAVRSVVIIPAHNEELELPKTLTMMTATQPTTSRILVVADHCTDETVSVAKSFGVDVIERQPPSKPGKSQALADGVRYLEHEPPDVVVMVDADCHFVDDGLQRLIISVHENQRAEQAIYRMEPPAPPSLHARLSAFAFQLKNEIRAKGLAAMNAPCHLTGSGMAFPWQQVCKLPLRSESLVEDLELGILLAERGTPAHLRANATILSRLPQNDEASLHQRRRWEHGYLRSMLPGIWRLFKAALHHRDKKLILLALDLCVPPLTFLSLLIAAGWVFSLLGVFLNFSSWPIFFLWSHTASLLFAAIIMATTRYPGTIIQFSELRTVPRYLMWKTPILFDFFYRPERNWQRTERTNHTSHP